MYHRKPLPSLNTLCSKDQRSKLLVPHGYLSRSTWLSSTASASQQRPGTSLQCPAPGISVLRTSSKGVAPGGASWASHVQLSATVTALLPPHGAQGDPGATLSASVWAGSLAAALQQSCSRAPAQGCLSSGICNVKL